MTAVFIALFLCANCLKESNFNQELQKKLHNLQTQMHQAKPCYKVTTSAEIDKIYCQEKARSACIGCYQIVNILFIPKLYATYMTTKNTISKLEKLSGIRETYF